MTGRTRSHLNRHERFSKYLKPGALAQIRDSKISARSNNITRRVNSLTSWLPSLPVPSVQIGDAESLEQLAKFSSPIYGSQRFGRKKLVAAKSCVFLLGFSATSPAVDSGDSIITPAQEDHFISFNGELIQQDPLPRHLKNLPNEVNPKDSGYKLAIFGAFLQHKFHFQFERMENNILERMSSRNEDFQESDVWDIMAKTKAMTIIACEQPYKGLLSRQLQSASRLIPKSTNPSPEPKLVNHSAPVNIPDWSKVYGKESSSRNTSYVDQDLYQEGRSTRNRLMSYNRNDDECDHEDYDDDDDDHSSRLPPHEWLARKHTKNRTASFSVCEGVGRTLKGRDLRRVRDAVLIKTTFI